ncbi:BgTH12-01639 [Blumeria graminis f. sp. triticale]|uniref:BgTH12-01639 n=1 Tax=Blumeria graminis f. sp. triticale TaxID=1689686 RepID=A0A9W4CZU3_BLUGR|nr:BgTH12-01639 [Blumeria graminis f. sp. triticale]
MTRNKKSAEDVDSEVITTEIGSQFPTDTSNSINFPGIIPARQWNPNQPAMELNNDDTNYYRSSRVSNPLVNNGELGSNLGSNDSCGPANHYIDQTNNPQLVISAFVPNEFVTYDVGEKEKVYTPPKLSGYTVDSVDFSSAPKTEDRVLNTKEFVSVSEHKHALQGDNLNSVCETIADSAMSSTLSLLSQAPTPIGCARTTLENDYGQPQNLNAIRLSNPDRQPPTQEETMNDPLPFPVNQITFKKLIPISTVEDYLSNPETMTYDGLYQRTEDIALLMVTLQDEARKIDKKLHDFEAAKKSKQQIAAEEAKLEEEQMQKEKDAIFEVLLNKYGSFARSTVEEWINFHENFYQNHVEENPKHRKILLLLRNPQYISDYYKRSFAKQKAELKAHTVKLANTIDSPPSKIEQKAMEESDRKKRKPVIDSLIFDDRKMTDVYGLSYKAGDAFVGNQILKDRYENSKYVNNISNVDEKFRPKRVRGKRGNYDTDQSDNTPVASDTEESLPVKRTRTTRLAVDRMASSRVSTKSRVPSRESTPSIAPKVFASGKRIGRPPGSKSQVKLPSKLKSVVAASDVIEKSHDSQQELISQFGENKTLGDKKILPGTVEEKEQDALEIPAKRIYAEGMISKNCIQIKLAGQEKQETRLQKDCPERLEVSLCSKPKIESNKCNRSFVALKFDKNVFPSPEADKSTVEFSAALSSRPSSSSSTDMALKLDRCNIRSASNVMVPSTTHHSTVKVRGRRSCRATTETLPQNVKSPPPAKKSKNRTIKDIVDDSKPSQPKKVFRVALKHTPPSASDTATKVSTPESLAPPANEIISSCKNSNSPIMKHELHEKEFQNFERKNSNSTEKLHMTSTNRDTNSQLVIQGRNENYMHDMHNTTSSHIRRVCQTKDSGIKDSPGSFDSTVSSNGINNGNNISKSSSRETFPSVAQENYPIVGDLLLHEGSFGIKNSLIHSVRDTPGIYNMCRDIRVNKANNIGSLHLGIRDFTHPNPEVLFTTDNRRQQTFPTRDQDFPPIEPLPAPTCSSSSLLISQPATSKIITRPNLLQHPTVSELCRNQILQFPTKLRKDLETVGDNFFPEQEHFLSEYERYQALTSSTSPFTLAKRKRKSRVDLASCS